MADDFGIGLGNSGLNIEIFYRITRLDSSQSLIVKRDVAAPKIVSGGSRWNVVNRPRKVGFITWDGSDPYRLDLPVLIDGFDTGRNMEDAISILNQMGMPPADYVKPPQVRIDGALPVKNAKWVLDPEISWGDNVIWHEDGYRLRQDAVVHLLQFVEATQLQIKAPSNATTYNVQTGDTLKSVSKKMYGTSKYWHNIQTANGIRDPKKLPKVLKIPVIVGR